MPMRALLWVDERGYAIDDQEQERGCAVRRRRRSRRPDPVRVFGQWAGHPDDAGRLERAVPILCDAALALSRDLA
jgi:hypothetical protein